MLNLALHCNILVRKCLSVLVAILAVQVYGLGISIGADLQLQMSFPQERFPVGSQITTKLTLKNISDRAIDVYPELEPEYGFVAFFISRNNSVEQNFRPYQLFNARGLKQRLFPGESIIRYARLFFGGGGQGWVFGLPGSYEVYATYRNPYAGSQEVVASNNCHIIVQRPITSGERSAAHLMLRRDLGKFLILGGTLEDANRIDEARTAYAALEEIASAPETDSPLAAEAKLSLGATIVHSQSAGEGQILNGLQLLRQAKDSKAIQEDPSKLIQIYQGLEKGLLATQNEPEAQRARGEFREKVERLFTGHEKQFLLQRLEIGVR